MTRTGARCEKFADASAREREWRAPRHAVGSRFFSGRQEKRSQVPLSSGIRLVKTSGKPHERMLPRTHLASAMSGTRFSGIAVAAANRRALVNQEREAAHRDAAHVKTLNAKEEALLASIRNQLLGGGKKKSGGGGAPGDASAKRRASSKGSGSEKPERLKRVTADGVEQYDDLDDLEDDEDEGGDARVAWDGDSDGKRAAVSGGERASPTPPAIEKRFMSKAERKRVKKQRMRAEASVGEKRAEPANAQKRQTHERDEDDEKKSDAARRKKKKKKREADAPHPPSPTWPPGRGKEGSES